MWTRSKIQTITDWDSQYGIDTQYAGLRTVAGQSVAVFHSNDPVLVQGGGGLAATTVDGNAFVMLSTGIDTDIAEFITGHELGHLDLGISGVIDHRSFISDLRQELYADWFSIFRHGANTRVAGMELYRYTCMMAYSGKTKMAYVNLIRQVVMMGYHVYKRITK
jgi:hypothetical protein